MERNLANVVALVTLATDFYALISPCFSRQVPWFGDTSQPASKSSSDTLAQYAQAGLLTLPSDSGSLLSSTLFVFLTCSGLALIYPVLIIPQLKASNEGSLGLDKEGLNLSR